jgi:XRE family aerobic/anaerobic benzoate catabolism transcriptional regulator
MATASDTEVSEAPQEIIEENDTSFLDSLGRRVREIRERRGMTRKLLAREAAVSERHLAHLEGGAGNISIVLLRRIAHAVGTTLGDLLAPEAEDKVEKIRALRAAGLTIRQISAATAGQAGLPRPISTRCCT